MSHDCVVLELGASLLKYLGATDYAGVQRDLLRAIKDRVGEGSVGNKIKIQRIDSVAGLKTYLGVRERESDGRRSTNVALVTDDPTYENRAQIVYVADSKDKDWNEMVARASRRSNVRVYTYDPSRGVAVSDAFVSLLQAL